MINYPSSGKLAYYQMTCFVFLAFYPGALFLLLAAYSDESQIAVTVAYMVLAVSLLSINDVGYLINHIDLSPRFSGVLMGVSNTAGTAAGCIVPVVTGYLTNEDVREICFFIIENFRVISFDKYKRIIKLEFTTHI